MHAGSWTVIPVVEHPSLVNTDRRNLLLFVLVMSCPDLARGGLLLEQEVRSTFPTALFCHTWFNT
jgi:hypothetical protein